MAHWLPFLSLTRQELDVSGPAAKHGEPCWITVVAVPKLRSGVAFGFVRGVGATGSCATASCKSGSLAARLARSWDSST